MSLHPRTSYHIPEETARVAKACLPQDHPYLRLADALGPIFQDHDFTALFPTRGQPAIAPGRLALISLLQFAENLSDRQAVHAVRSRIDWKYLLGLELTDAGCDHTVLSEFRTRLVQHDAVTQLFEALLRQFQALGLLKARGRQRTDSTHVLAAVSALNRVELVGEAMRAALNSLAEAAPVWLRGHIPPEWYTRYGARVEAYRLPKDKAKRHALAESIGADGMTLFRALYASSAPGALRDLPAVERLRQIWVQNYLPTDAGVCWRENDNIPPAASFLSSPYDPDAHYARKHTTQWVGYKVHLTETCDDVLPPLITHVETTPAPVDDSQVTAQLHAALQEKALLPSRHIVDTGYLDAELLATSQRDYGVELWGPTRQDVRWQAHVEGGFDVSQFVIDWDQEIATCPAGHTSISWTPAIDNRANEVIKIKFSSTDCRSCPHRSQCTRAQRYPRRTITVRPREQYEALKAARERQATATFAQEYARRAGIEGTLSYGIRACGLRRSRYIGLARTHVQHVLTAAAMNLARVARWLAGEPRARTRRSPLLRLQQAA
jgi:transposase